MGKLIALVGGNGGIGLAAANQFVERGAYGFVTGCRQRELAAAVKEVGKNATGVQGDVSNPADLDRLFAQIEQEKGRLDVLFWCREIRAVGLDIRSDFQHTAPTRCPPHRLHDSGKLAGGELRFRAG